MRRLNGVAGALLLVGCMHGQHEQGDVFVGSPGAGAQGGAASTPTQSAWGVPPQLRTALDGETSVYRGESDEAFGTIEGFTLVDVAGPVAERTLVSLTGPLSVRGHVPTTRLEAIVQRAGRVRGTPTSVGNNNRVRIVGPAHEPGRTRISVTPRVQRTDVGTWEGTFATSALGVRFATGGPGLPEGERMFAPANTPLVLHDAPGGEPVVTLPAFERPVHVVVVRTSGAWRGVRVGTGPFVIGWTNAALEPPPPSDGVLVSGHGVGSGGGPSALPRVIAEDSTHPLHRVAAGTEVTFADAQPFGLLNAPGWARELERNEHDGRIFARIAVDDGASVRGFIPIASLSPP